MSKVIFDGDNVGGGPGSGELFIFDTSTDSLLPVVSLNGASPNYVGQVNSELGSNLSPELLTYDGFVFLQGVDNGFGPKVNGVGQETQDGLFVYDIATKQSVELGKQSEGSNGLTPTDFTVYNDNVYFNGDGNLYEITAGKDIATSSLLSQMTVKEIATAVDPSSMVQYEGSLFMNSGGNFVSYNSTTNTILTRAGGVNPTDMIVAGNDLFFNGVDPNGLGNELFVFNPAASLTKVIPDPAPSNANATDALGNRGLDPLDIVGLPVNSVGDSTAYYSGVKDAFGDRNIYTTTVGPHGGVSTTEAFPERTLGTNPAANNLDPYDLTLIGNDLFFTGDDKAGGRGLFVLDTTNNSYREIVSSSQYNLDYDNTYNPTWGDLNPNTLTAVGSTLYFGAAVGNGSGPAQPNGAGALYEITVSASGAISHPTQVATNGGGPGLGPVSLTHT